LEFYVKAYRAHPRNSEAVDGITHLAVTLSKAALSSGRPDDLDAVKANIEAIMNVDDYLAKNEILVESRDAIIAIQ
jgi:hypothetical protein